MYYDIEFWPNQRAKRAAVGIKGDPARRVNPEI
jgi:hypothetical protein